MEWLLAALAVLVLGVAAYMATGRLGELPDLVDDRVAPELPDRALTADDLTQVDFAVVPRGYSMDQVDDLLDRLAAEMRPTRAGSSEPLVSEAVGVPAPVTAGLEAGEPPGATPVAGLTTDGDPTQPGTAPELGDEPSETTGPKSVEPAVPRATGHTLAAPSDTQGG